MNVEETVTHLEMTSPDQLRPARPVDAVTLERVEAVSLIRSTLERIAAPYHWAILSWSDEQWDRWLADPRLRQWLVRHHTEVAGLVELETQPGGQVEITSFGLVPEFVGRGIGGYALTLATRLAWTLDAVDAPAVRRVWLHTSTLDHPNALANYGSRGFRPFRTDVRQRELPP